MKRDIELIRKLLFFFDEKEGPQCVKVPPIEGYADDTIKYHCILLYDAGYLRCESIGSSTSDRVIYVVPFELTWDGHEFLEKIRNELIWDEINNSIEERGFISASVDLIKRLADKAIRKRMGLE